MGVCHCGKRNQHISSGGDIHEFYKIGDVLGSGSFGQVRLCTSKRTNQVFAVKIMAKDPSRHKRYRSNVDYSAMFHNEISLLFQLRHRNIVRLHEFYEDQHYFYAVMERCEGGELFTHIVKSRYFPEADASLLCYEMLKAIHYVHSCNIVHRDIKAENFLFSDSSRGGRLVLIDFGMSIRIADDKDLRQLCGSPHYVAPELIRRSYRFKVDMWALGVVVFLMIFGRYPFVGRDQNSIVQAILNSHPDYSRNSKTPSKLAIDFISSLLEKNPDVRLGAGEAMQHPWIQKHLRCLRQKRIPSSSSVNGEDNHSFLKMLDTPYTFHPSRSKETQTLPVSGRSTQKLSSSSSCSSSLKHEPSDHTLFVRRFTATHSLSPNFPSDPGERLSSAMTT